MQRITTFLWFDKEAEIEVRQLFEPEDFGPSEAVERFRAMGVGAKQ